MLLLCLPPLNIKWHKLRLVAVASAAVAPGINILLCILAWEVHIMAWLAQVGRACHAVVCIGNIQSTWVTCVPIRKYFNNVWIRGCLCAPLGWDAAMWGKTVHVLSTGGWRGSVHIARLKPPNRGSKRTARWRTTRIEWRVWTLYSGWATTIPFQPCWTVWGHGRCCSAHSKWQCKFRIHSKLGRGSKEGILTTTRVYTSSYVMVTSIFEYIGILGTVERATMAMILPL